MNKRSISMALLVLSTVVLTVGGCDDEQAKKMLAEATLRADQKMEEVKASGAPTLAVDSYNRASDSYSKSKDLANRKLYRDAYNEYNAFNQLADQAIADANRAKAAKAQPAVKPVEKPATPAVVESKTLTLKQGEYLVKIARERYKDQRKWKEIYNLNKDKIKDPNLVYPNQEIKLP